VLPFTKPVSFGGLDDAERFMKSCNYCTANTAHEIVTMDV